MAEAKVGHDFIKHEFDEAIAIQHSIVEAQRRLSESHPLPTAKREIKSQIRESERQLKELEKYGKEFGASGEVEDVAGAMKQLSEKTLQSAGEAKSEAYEAHAVLLSMIRKQQDSAGSVLKIARATKHDKLRTAAQQMQRKNKQAAETLAKSLSEFAVVIATNGRVNLARGSRSGGRPSRSSGSRTRRARKT
jgi:hypothetical protein